MFNWCEVKLEYQAERGAAVGGTGAAWQPDLSRCGQTGSLVCRRGGQWKISFYKHDPLYLIAVNMLYAPADPDHYIHPRD